MLDDSKLEELAETAKTSYMETTNMSEFVEAMVKKHYNEPKYIFRAMFIAISAFDMAKEK